MEIEKIMKHQLNVFLCFTPQNVIFITLLHSNLPLNKN